MYTFCIVLIIIASILMILAVLVQSPKSGMAANFGASNQVLGVRQTADFLEKFTWSIAAVVLVLSILSTIFVGGHIKSNNASSAAHDLEMLSTPEEPTAEIPQIEFPVEEAATPAPAETPAN